jgi:beta-ureidopropionase / N-carbamoyl-L-amino-acid hydrolase
VLDALEAAIEDEIAAIASALGLEILLAPVQRSAPVRFDPCVVDAVRAAAEAGGYSHRDIISGAGHDAVHVAALAPTAMIFVPCKDGLSHNEAESITQDQAAAGTETLLRAVLALAG